MAADKVRISYEHLAHQIEREDGLINTRVTWMLTFEGFLFAALALVASKESDPTIQMVLKYALPIIGFVIAFLAYHAIGAALSTLTYLKDLWEPENYPGYPQPFGKEMQHTRGASYSKGLPVTIMVLWFVVFIAFAISDFTKAL